MNSNLNSSWELMVFHLNGNKLNDFGALAYAESRLHDAGMAVVHREEHLKLSERLHKPDWRDRFLAS